MSWFSNLVGSAESAGKGLAESAESFGSGVKSFISHPGKSTVGEGERLVQDYNKGLAIPQGGLKIPGLGGGGGGSSDPPAGPPTAEQQADALIKGLTYSQASGTGATATAKQLAQLLSGMPYADAQKWIKANVPPGTALATDLSNALSGASSTPTTPANPYGFDPLSFSQFFQSTLGPFLQQEGKQASAENAQYSSAMADALKGASPEIQQAYKSTIPALQYANSLENQSQQQMVFAGPEFDTLMSGLSGATTAAKAAQVAAAEEPYVAATTGVTSPATTSAGNAQSQQNLIQSLYSQLLGAQQGTPTSPGSTILPNTITPASAAGNLANTNALNAYSAALGAGA